MWKRIRKLVESLYLLNNWAIEEEKVTRVVKVVKEFFIVEINIANINLIILIKSNYISYYIILGAWMN